MRFYQAVLDTLTAKGFTNEQKQEIKDKLIVVSCYESMVLDSEGEEITNPISDGTHIDNYLRAVILSEIKDGEEIIRRKAIEQLEIDTNGCRIDVTVSVGVTCYHPSTDKKEKSEILAEADNALYNSKNKGRNMISIHNNG